MLTSIHSSEKYTQFRGLTQLDKLLTDRPTNRQMAKGAKINLGFKKNTFGMLLSVFLNKGWNTAISVIYNFIFNCIFI